MATFVVVTSPTRQQQGKGDEVLEQKKKAQGMWRGAGGHRGGEVSLRGLPSGQRPGQWDHRKVV